MKQIFSSIIGLFPSILDNEKKNVTKTLNSPDAPPQESVFFNFHNINIIENN